jgi:hypothetical protein
LEVILETIAYLILVLVVCYRKVRLARTVGLKTWVGILQILLVAIVCSVFAVVFFVFLGFVRFYGNLDDLSRILITILMLIGFLFFPYLINVFYNLTLSPRAKHIKEFHIWML